MYDRTATKVAEPATFALADARLDQECHARLNWLLKANQETAQHRQLFRDDREEQEMLLMRHPLTARQAYGLYGLLLGTFPPAAIFYQIFHTPYQNADSGIIALCVLMNIVCALTGLWFGSVFSDSMARLSRVGWPRATVCSFLYGLLWGLCAGALGGLVFFGFGAIFGVLCGAPGGALGFLLFAPLHRQLARGGMIEARHFWPLACGITLTLTALIINLQTIVQVLETLFQ